jgi:hypothetical protein
MNMIKILRLETHTCRKLKVLTTVQNEFEKDSKEQHKLLTWDFVLQTTTRKDSGGPH